MEKKLVIFRCPETLARQLDELCRRNGVDRTRLVTCAVLSVIRDLSQQEAISPLREENLPPSPATFRSRIRRRHANT